MLAPAPLRATRRTKKVPFGAVTGKAVAVGDSTKVARLASPLADPACNWYPVRAPLVGGVQRKVTSDPASVAVKSRGRPGVPVTVSACSLDGRLAATPFSARTRTNQSPVEGNSSAKRRARGSTSTDSVASPGVGPASTR